MRNKRIYIYLILATTMAVMILFIGQTLTWAASALCSKTMTETNVDTDSDGFTNYQECMLNGVVTPLDGSTKVWGQLQATLLKTPINCASPPAGNICLDPDYKNLFVVLVSNPTNTLLPASPLKYLTDEIGYSSTNPSGMIINQIKVSKAPLDRTVFTGSKQKAVMVTEGRDTTSWDVLGFSNTGIPSGLDQATIYTDRIKYAIMTACGCTGTYSVSAGPPYYGLNCSSGSYGTDKCKDSTGLYDSINTTTKTYNYNLTNKYIQHTIAHEIGHVLGPLAPNYDANYGGYHYMPGANVLMDQSIYYTYSKSTITTTFYIGTNFTASDKSAARLIP
jgi:hypothetical protein